MNETLPPKASTIARELDLKFNLIINCEIVDDRYNDDRRWSLLDWAATFGEPMSYNQLCVRLSHLTEKGLDLTDISALFGQLDPIIVNEYGKEEEESEEKEQANA